MFKKILILVSCLSAIFVAVVAYNYISHYMRFEQHKEELAFRLYELEKIPLEQRSADIHMEMAHLYYRLDYNPKNVIKAYINASNAGDSRATYNLAILSGYGKNVGDDLPDYETLFKKAAQQGSLNAAFTIKARDILGLEFMPFGYEASFVKLAEAANQGNIEAAFVICSHGNLASSQGIIVGYMGYCDEPVKQGYPPALYFMGRMHEQNTAEYAPDTWAHLGVEKNLTKAKEFYQRAADQSYGPAIERLEILKNQTPLIVIKSEDKLAYLPDINPDWFE